MTANSLAVLLSQDERRLIATLRALPEGALRERVWGMLEHLAQLLHEPRCAQAQADGVPCPHPGGECDQCRRVFEELDALPITAVNG